MKKILIITQKVDRNDSILGFFHRWIEEFSLQYDSVIVICLYAGSYSFNKNVTVHSLGKEEKKSRIRYIYRFYKYIWKFRKEYDVVFVHMNQVYVILGAFVWFFLKKKVALWYAHGYVPYSLKIAERFSSIIFTSTKSGFRLLSKKIKIVGQGIDTDFFKPQTGHHITTPSLNIVTVGRISPVKNYELIIKAVAQSISKGANVNLDIVGDAQGDTQEKYLKQLHSYVSEYNLSDRVRFSGAVPQHELPVKLSQASLFINASKTGSLDKTGLEAMALELPILTSNEAYIEILGSDADTYMFDSDDVEALTRKIMDFSALNKEARLAIGKNMRKIVVQSHNISALISRIKSTYDSYI